MKDAEARQEVDSLASSADVVGADEQVAAVAVRAGQESWFHTGKAIRAGAVRSAIGRCGYRLLAIMQPDPLQFAVVREDPEIERRVLVGLGRQPQQVLLVASGGCTALSLQAWFPQTSFTLVDPNPAQLELVRRKVAVLERGLDRAALARFDVGEAERECPGLSQGGNFESLFRGLRRFLHEMVVPRSETRGWFEPGVESGAIEAVFGRRYWAAAFEMFFCDALLVAMFGPAAVQHAAAGSYPQYFRRRIERGLLREDAADNYFLHHILLGHYLPRPAALPHYLAAPARRHHFEYRQTTLAGIDDLRRYDLIDLSNVMDWMSPAESEQLISLLRAEVRPGAVVVWRQLNNERDRGAGLGAGFAFDAAGDTELTALDRSLFYCRVHAARRRGPPCVT